MGSKGGRPEDYSAEVAGRICQRMAEGESLRQICEDSGMPSKTSVMRWLAKHDEFRDQYAHAMDLRADAKFEEMEDLALGATPETVQVVKLHLDTLKWVLERQKPKKYGSAQRIEHSGRIGTAKELTDDELARIAAGGGTGAAGKT